MEETQHLPPGFRFHPTDEELITYYLTNKVSDFDFTTAAMADVDLNKCEPWDLPGKASMGEREWYFFSLRDRKYPTGLRTNRATEAGYWKTTGKDKEIFRRGELVGMKKTLVFYRGRAPKGEKTNWVMHEYRLHNNIALKTTKEEWVVCRIFQKSTRVKTTPQPITSPPPSESGGDGNAMADELGDMELPNFSSNSNIMNWNTGTDAAVNSLTWPSNLSINSLLLTALQLRGGGASTDSYSLMTQTNNLMNQFGHGHGNVNHDLDFNMASASHPPYNVDSNIW